MDGYTVGGRATVEPKVHFITQTRRTASVPISETLSRLHIETNGSCAIIRGTRTSFQSFSTKGSAQVYLADGSPFWELGFKPLRRPIRASAASTVMQDRDWLGCLLVCTPCAEQRTANETLICSPSSSSSAPDAKYGPCRYGALCRDKGDPIHCAKYSHPLGPARCATEGCGRGPSGRYLTCCAQCKASGGVTHSSSCSEIAPVAWLVVEDATCDGDNWILNLRSLSENAVSTCSKLCRYRCGMRAYRDMSGKAYDTCCKKCSSGCGRSGHDSFCSGPAEVVDLREFEESIDLSPLFFGQASERSLGGSKPKDLSVLQDDSVPKECRICFDDDLGDAPRVCQFPHYFCKGCMGRHIEEELCSKGICPACPLSSECGHLLNRRQVADVMASKENANDILGRFDLLSQRLGLQAIGAFPCARAECQDWIVPSQPGRQQLVECPNCKIRFCSLCKRKPYHWRISSCADVPAVDEAWREWLRSDRDDYIAKLATEDPEYLKILEQLGSKKAEQAKMLLEAEARKREFDEMEDWKVKNCKCCPSCKRVINKVDGCDSMKCGQNYHGGDVQNGCGASFNWATAPPYEAQKPDHITKVEVDLGDHDVHKRFWEIEPGIYLRCAMCKFAIRGPLFLCIDCIACCACLRCANGMGSASGGKHLPDSHAFAIIWKLEDLRRADKQILQEHFLTTRRKTTRPDEKLSPEETLTDMGFPLDVARKALADARGDVEQASAMLLG